METKKILVGSPVRQKHLVLAQFLAGLEEADKSGFSVSYYFIDDNVDEKSTELLRNFAKNHDAIIKKGNDLTRLGEFSKYVSDEVTHVWDTNTIQKVAFFKDTIIEYALNNRFDYLFFIDSDIVIDHRTLQQLVSRNVEIVSNVFWTQWKPNWQLEPQCFWIPALSRRDESPFSQKQIDIEDARQIQRDFFAKMRVPGIYKVDGLGACTLIAFSALEKGVRFKEIPNLGLLGEDRHFCIRAGALDISLYYDTVYPVYHIYREEYLDRVDEFKREGFKYDMCQTFVAEHQVKQSRVAEIKRIIRKIGDYVDRKTVSKIKKKKNRSIVYERNDCNQTIALQMIVRDQSLKYFEEALQSLNGIADFYIIADATNSGTGTEKVEEILSKQKCIIIHADASQTDYELFQKLWIASEQYEPNWICAFFADEVIQEDAAKVIRYLIKNTTIDAYYFRRYDMWNKDEYREDSVWNTHKGYTPYLMRYQKDYQFHWDEGKYEKFPDELSQLRYAGINLKVRCYQWADITDRKHLARISVADMEKQKTDTLLDECIVLKKYCNLTNEI